MKMNVHRRTLFAASLLAASVLPVQAGQEIASAGKATKEITAPVREFFPDEPRGMVTVGGLFSERLTGMYVDTVTGLWAPQQRDAFFFLNSRYHYEDNGQFISSTGFGFRALLPDRDVILGLNAYWDALSSERGSDFNQLGVGAEILTKWVDARFNYYLPEDDRVEVSHNRSRSIDRVRGPGLFRNTIKTSSFIREEAALQGFNAEIGVLLPICKYTEVRLYGGYFHYDNPFGSDFSGFKARLEARLLPGVIADVEYWEDAALMGGHWTAGIRASVPFSIYNLVTGRNPFEGIGETFTPRPREFRERMGDMVERSHRIQTVTSGERQQEFSRETTYHSIAKGRGIGGNGGQGGGGGAFPIE